MFAVWLRTQASTARIWAGRIVPLSSRSSRTDKIVASGEACRITPATNVPCWGPNGQSG
jgi:hypothetical protein